MTRLPHLPYQAVSVEDERLDGAEERPGERGNDAGRFEVWTVAPISLPCCHALKDQEAGGTCFRGHGNPQGELPAFGRDWSRGLSRVRTRLLATQRPLATTIVAATTVSIRITERISQVPNLVLSTQCPRA